MHLRLVFILIALCPLSVAIVLPCFAQTLPAPIDLEAVTGALEDDGKDKPKKAKSSSVPRRSPEDIRREAADNKAWVEVRSAAKADQPENQLQAIDTYKAFFTSRPLHPIVGAAVSAAIADLYVRQEDIANATRIYEWATKEYAGMPAAARLIPGQAMLLNLQEKPEEAATLLRGNWDAVMAASTMDPVFARSALEDLVTLSRTRNKIETAIEPLKHALVQVPGLASGGKDSNLWAYDTLVELLFEAGRREEAVGVARLRFMQCSFNKHNIEPASVFLTRVWRRHDTSGKEVEAFAAAQSVPASDEAGKKANPLFNYPIPKVAEEVWQSTLSRLPVNSARLRINVLISAGEFGLAMQQAETFYAQNTGKNEAAARVGITEACRVLKAADLNLVRGNALLSFLQTKQGQNPLPEFYKQHPPREIASTEDSNG